MRVCIRQWQSFAEIEIILIMKTPTLAKLHSGHQARLWRCREDHYYGNMSRFREHVWFNLRDLPLFLWRDSSVQHFDTLTGDYVWPTRTNSCVPFRDIALDDANQLRTWNPALDVGLLCLHSTLMLAP